MARRRAISKDPGAAGPSTNRPRAGSYSSGWRLRREKRSHEEDGGEKQQQLRGGDDTLRNIHKHFILSSTCLRKRRFSRRSPVCTIKPLCEHADYESVRLPVFLLCVMMSLIGTAQSFVGGPPKVPPPRRTSVAKMNGRLSQQLTAKNLKQKAARGRKPAQKTRAMNQSASKGARFAPQRGVGKRK